MLPPFLVKKRKRNINIFSDISWSSFDIFGAEFDSDENILYVYGDGSLDIMIYDLNEDKAVGKKQKLINRRRCALL